MSILDLSPDPTRPGPADILARNLYFKDSLTATHTTLAVSNTLSQSVDSAMRINRVYVGTVSGGTVTIQIQVNGRDIFDDTLRPVSGGESRWPTDKYIITPGSLISSIIEATSGVPTGNANVVIKVSPFTLLPRTAQRQPRGPERLRLSKRTDYAVSNAGVDLTTLFPRAVTAAHPIGSSATLGRGIQTVNLRGEVIHFRPRRPR